VTLCEGQRAASWQFLAAGMCQHEERASGKNSCLARRAGARAPWSGRAGRRVRSCAAPSDHCTAWSRPCPLCAKETLAIDFHQLFDDSMRVYCVFVGYFTRSLWVCVEDEVSHSGRRVCVEVFASFGMLQRQPFSAYCNHSRYCHPLLEHVG